MAVDSVLGSTGTASSLSVGGTVNGTVDAGGDQDWYRITLVAGQQYRFDLQGLASIEGALSDPYLRLLNSGGSEIAFNDDSAGALDSSITFTALAGGTYYLSAQGFGAASGTFSLSATDITSGAGDVPANTGTGHSVAVGGSVTGTIGAGGDQDWYQVSLINGHQYRFDLQGLFSGQGTLSDPYLRLLNGSGNQIAFNDDAVGSLDSSITYTATASGTFFLSAQAFDPAGIGTFRLSVTDLVASGPDVPASTGTGSTVPIGGSRTGTIGTGGDQDWYRVTLAAGHEYRFDLEGFASGEGTLDDPVLRLLDGSGSEIAFNDDADGSLDSRIIFTPTDGGTYFLAAQGFLDSAGTFRISAADLGAPDPDVPGGTGSTASVSIGSSRTGTIGASGDQDWYRVSLVAGHQYRFDLRGFASGEGTLTDPLLRLLNGSGNLIAANDDAGGKLESSIAYTATASGTYFLAARGYESSTGTFRLTATELTGGTGDVPSITGSSGAVAIGGLVSGAIETGSDQDWYRVTLVSGHQYRFDLRGVNSGEGTLSDPYLRLLSNSGSELRFDDDSGAGRDARITYTALQTGTYYLSAESYEGYSIGTYTLGAADLTAGSGDIAGATGTKGRVFVGGSVSGTVGANGDQDWYQVTLLAGRQYRFELSGSDSDLGTLADPYLRLFNSSGVKLDFDDDSGPGRESSLVFNATQTGTYYISAGSYKGFSTGTFRLTVSDTAVDVAGGIGTGSNALIGDTVGGRINAAGDEDWYRVVLTAGHEYAFDLLGASSGEGTLSDPLLRLLNGSGAEIVLDDDSGRDFDSSIVFTPAQSGTYYLSAEGYSASAGTFRLSAFDLDDPLDILAGPGTGASVAMRGSTTGTIDTEAGGDHDWYRIELVAGRTYRFDLRGADSDDGSLSDPFLRLFNHLGNNEITFDDDSGSGRNSSITYTASHTRTYFLSAEGFSYASGTFTLSVTDLSAGTGDVLSNINTTSTIAVGGSVAGTIAANGDEDWYWVFLTAGHEYHFELQGLDSSTGTLADPYLRVFDSTGAQVDFDDDSGAGRDSSLVYTAPQSGYYFLGTSDYGLQNSGTFVLSASDGPPDVLASTGTNGTLVPGGSVGSAIDVLGDEDWYRVLLLAGHDYRFDLKGESSLQGTLHDPYLRLLDEGGSQIVFNDDSGAGRDSRITYTASQSGYYYLSAQAFAHTSTGTYTLGAVDLSSSDVAGSVATGGEITAGGLVTGTIDAVGDADWYAVTLIAGRQYRFDLRGADSGQGTLQDPFLRLLNGSGGEIKTDDDSGPAGLDAKINYTASQTGTYYLSAEGYGFSQTGTFSLKVLDLTGGEIPGDTGTGASVVVGGSVTGAIDGGGDQDWYRVTLTAGHEYRFDLRGLDSGAGTLTDPYLRLLDGFGSEIGFDDDAGAERDSSIVYIAGATDEYFLSAQHYSTGTGTFVLDVFDLTGGTVGERTFTGTGGSDSLTGSEFDDLVQGLDGSDQLDGKGGDDTVAGSGGNDDLSGGIGDDSIVGGTGNDAFLHVTLESIGDDTLISGSGDDILHDHFGNNVLDGGTGDDLFVVYIADAGGVNLAAGGAGRDIYQVLPRAVSTNKTGYVITDFEVGIGSDLLDVNALLDASAEGLFFVPGVSDVSDFVRLAQSGPDALLQWDRDGTGSAYDWKTYLTLKSIDADKVESGNFSGRVDIGTKSNDDLNGTGGDDFLAAADGHDTLDGGVGMDVMAGGNGRDRYYVDDAKDVVVESIAGLPPGALAGLAIDEALRAQLLAVIGKDPDELDDFTDTVIAVVNYSLDNVQFVEDLTLSGTATEGTGNGLNNVLTGNAIANRLSGLGGNDTLDGLGGADTLLGGGGNDTYVVNNAGDVVSEGASGIDGIQTTVTLVGALAANVESVRLMGTGNLNATGNSGANVLYANSGSNVLNGGTGNDTVSYEFGATAGVTASLAVTTAQATGGSGSDRFVSVERLTGSSHADKLTGSAGSNVVTGLNGHDTLAGGGGNDTLVGGTGKDTLTGGGGQDKFDFNTALSAVTNVDRITDFSLAGDLIRLDRDVFTALAAGNLAAGAFRSAPNVSTAGDASDRIIYNETNGNLYYDPDGTGATAAKLFAILAGAPAITENDIFIIA